MGRQRRLEDVIYSPTADLSILKVGMEFENYSEMCRALKIKPPMGADEKKYQVRELQRHFDWKLEPTFSSRKKVTITEIYETPKPIIDGRGKHPNSRGNRKGIKLKQ